MSLFDHYEKKSILDFQTGDRIQNYFKILSVQKKTKKNGEPYLDLELLDKSGKIGGKIWENLEVYLPLIQTGEIYRISGFVTEFQKRKEVRVETVKTVSIEGNGIKKEDFEEKAPFDVKILLQDLIKTLKEHIRNPFLLELINRFFQNYSEPFTQHYGAQKIHHAYSGGLLEHTLSVIKLAARVGDFYGLDTELLLIGALFHDIGKLVEYTRTPAVETTKEGGLIGHPILGNQIFLEIQNEIKDFPRDLSVRIQHLIISHHGEREFGAPEVPKTPEAFALHIIDLLDSKIKIFQETIQQADKSSLFSEYNRVLNRRIFIPNNNPKDR